MPEKEPVQETVVEGEGVRELADDKFKRYLKEPVIQWYILLLNEILEEVSITNEYNREGRLEIANKKLQDLRANGLEYNELFDEFCQYALSLDQRTSP